jgi:hypothetical protein
MAKRAHLKDAPTSPQLHLGWQCDTGSEKVPVCLRAAGLTAHLAVIAQSGSGKSFMLGRMLEEIAGKTRARLLILDPNSDFVKFGAVDTSSWDRHKDSFGKGDTPSSFKRRWRSVGVSTITDRDAESLGDKGFSKISLSWPELSEDMKLGYLGISAESHPAEHAVFHFAQAAIYNYLGPASPRTLEALFHATNGMWYAELHNGPLTGLNEWPGNRRWGCRLMSAFGGLADITIRWRHVR